MHEPSFFAPTYSIIYGFPDGAQNDIFVNTNPVGYTSKPFPAEQRCGNASSRLVSSGGNGTQILRANDVLRSPNCQYQAWFAGDGAIAVGDNSEETHNMSDSLDRNSWWDINFYWQTGVNPGGNGWTSYITDQGDVIIKNSNGQLRWTSPMTNGKGIAPFRLDLTNDGQLVLFDSAGTNLWESSWK